MDSKTGKKVAISAMACALLGTSGYIVYDKGFAKENKEPVKLASNTEKKEDRITGNNNGFPSMFSNSSEEAGKKENKADGEKGKVNLADLLSNNKSPITPIVYNPNEIQVEKKEPEIKLDGNTKPGENPIPAVVTPTPIPVNTGDNKGVDNKPGEIVTPPIEGEKPPIVIPNGNEGQNGGNQGGNNSHNGGNGNIDGNQEENGGKNEDTPSHEDARPAKPNVIISISPYTGDKMISWYIKETNETYSTVFFSDFYDQEQKEEQLKNLSNSTDQKDLVLLSQTNTISSPKLKAQALLGKQNLDQILTRKHSDENMLFYIRNQMNVLNSNMATAPELDRFVNNKEEEIKQLSTDIFNAAQMDENAWRSNPASASSFNKALSKYYLLTSLLKGVDPQVEKESKEHIQSMFDTIIEREVKEMAGRDVQKESAIKTEKTNKEQTVSQENKKEQAAKQEDKKKDEQGKDIKAAQSSPVEDVIVTIKEYIDNEEKRDYKKAITLADQWIDYPLHTDEQLAQLQELLGKAVNALVIQSDEVANPLDALQNYHFFTNVNHLSSDQKNKANEQAMALVFEVKANDAAAENAYYDAVMYMANSIRNNNSSERAMINLVNYTKILRGQADGAWDEIRGTSDWKEKGEQKVFPAYRLISQLSDIDNRIGKDERMIPQIQYATGKMEGIELLTYALQVYTKPNEEYNALYYFGQAYARGEYDFASYEKLLNKLMEKAEVYEAKQYTEALKLYQLIYQTPGSTDQHMKYKNKESLKQRIEYLNDYYIANEMYKKYEQSKNNEELAKNNEELATAIAHLHRAIVTGHPDKNLLGNWAQTLLDNANASFKANHHDQAYNYYAFLADGKNYPNIPSDIREKAVEGLKQYK